MVFLPWPISGNHKMNYLPFFNEYINEIRYPGLVWIVKISCYKGGDCKNRISATVPRKNGGYGVLD